MGASNVKTPVRQLPLTAMVARAGGAEGDSGAPHLVYTWQGHDNHNLTLVRSYTPSGGGAPRLVATQNYGGQDHHWVLSVWDTGTGACLGALEGPEQRRGFGSLVTYQRASDGRPRIATGSDDGRVCIWDGDDYSMRLKLLADPKGHSVGFLAVYEEPTSRKTRLITG
jgi:WD40 repeat protein